jgi:hypothetical protein
MEKTATVRGCGICVTEFPHRLGRCPLCGKADIDTFSRPYWDSIAAEGSMQEVRNDAQQAYIRRKQQFLADIIRVCRIYNLYLEPEHHIHGAYEESYLTVRPMKSEAELAGIKQAI